MKVAILDEPSPDWDRFVAARPEALLGHAAAWGSIFRSAYGLKPLYLEARAGGGDLVGTLPLVLFRALRGGKELISLPFLDSAGVLSEAPEAQEALLAAALGLARRERCAALELRSTPASVDELTPRDRVGMVLQLAESEEAQWDALRPEARNQTRKARKQGLQIASGDVNDLLCAFLVVFRQNMRDLGSPVHSEGFFAAMAAQFGARLRFIVARLGERPVGGLVAIQYGGAVAVPWASTLRSERSRCPNNLIYWEALRWAIELGATEFDFGRSEPGGGTHRFKRGWGAEERPLEWQRLSPDGQPLPLNRSRDSPALSRLSQLWTRLPVAWSARVGPALRRFLPE